MCAAQKDKKVSAITTLERQREIEFELTAVRRHQLSVARVSVLAGGAGWSGLGSSSIASAP